MSGPIRLVTAALGRCAHRLPARRLHRLPGRRSRGNCAYSSTEEAASLRDFGDRPLVVLTAGSGSSADWSAQQDALATLSTDSVHRVVKGFDHASMVTDEEGAGAATRAILDVVSSVRTGRPLAE